MNFSGKAIWPLFLLALTITLVIPIVFFLTANFSKSRLPQESETPIVVTSNPVPAPEISGWVAWWAEDSAYTLIASNPGELTSVSPVWFQIKENMQLADIGKVDRAKVVALLKTENIKILPSLGSELSGESLGRLLKDSDLTTKLVNDLVHQLVALRVDGVDIDLEGLPGEDQDAFIQFLQDLKSVLKQHNLYLAVAVQAQASPIRWDGVKGQDLRKIAEIADEVRIMTYDQHSSASDSGPIADLDWIRLVALYNSFLGDKKKIVMGLPSYGYVWETAGPKKGLQFDEFSKYLEGKEVEPKRDAASGELVYTTDKFMGWLSDASAMHKKINALTGLGFNRFIIWHLGGMDEKFFATDKP